MNKHLFRALCKAGRYAVTVCVLTAVLSACGKEDDPVNKQPVYTYQKEKEYLFTMPVYNDVIRFYKYNTRVTQTNPDAVVSEEEIKAREDEINQKVEIVTLDDLQNMKVVMRNVGFEINNQSFDYNLCMFCWDKAGEFVKPDKYAMLGRDSLIQLFKNSDVHGYTTTFDFLKDEFRVFFSSDVYLDRNTLGLFIGNDLYVGDLSVDYKAYHLNTNLLMPDECIKEYMLIYDRFDNRSYNGKDGNIYSTKVICEYLNEIKDFDSSAKSPFVFNMKSIYPIVQLFENDKLIFEGITSKYTEFYERNSAQTETFVGFIASTLKDKCVYQLEYHRLGGTKQFELKLMDFVNLDLDGSFSIKEDNHIYIFDDYKTGSKKTLSFVNNGLQ